MNVNVVGCCKTVPLAKKWPFHLVNLFNAATCRFKHPLARMIECKKMIQILYINSLSVEISSAATFLHLRGAHPAVWVFEKVAAGAVWLLLIF
jgi:hypothetical protein